MAIHAEAVEILVHKSHLEPEVALGVAEAIEISINLTQVVTIPVLDARLQELRHDIKSDFAEMRTEIVSEFEKMRAQTASEFGRMRADMADQIGKVRVEMANEFGKVRVEIGEVRTEMADEFGKTRTETQAVKADLMRWVLLTLVSSAAITAAVTPLVKGFSN